MFKKGAEYIELNCQRIETDTAFQSYFVFEGLWTWAVLVGHELDRHRASKIIHGGLFCPYVTSPYHYGAS